jgi:hypothetical protein
MNLRTPASAPPGVLVKYRKRNSTPQQKDAASQASVAGACRMTKDHLDAN